MNHWGVNIAMRDGGELTLAALAVPTSKTLITAQVNIGVQLNGEEFTVAGIDRDLGEVAVGLEVDGQEVWRKLLNSGGLDWVTQVGTGQRLFIRRVSLDARGKRPDGSSSVLSH